MKILQICYGEGKEGGGIGVIASKMAEDFSFEGQESVLASCIESHSAQSKSFKRDYKFKKINFIQIPFFSSVVIPLNLHQIILEENPDIIISHGYGSSLPLVSHLVSFFAKKRHFFVIHAYPKFKGIKFLLTFLYDLAAYPAVLSSRIIYFSNNAFSFIKKPGLIVNTSPANIFFGKKPFNQGNYLLFVGRLDENKRPDIFVKICAKLGEKGIIVGKDEGFLSSSKEIADSLKANVEFKEMQYSAMPEAYKNAKAVVMTSEYEGLPLIWLESIAANKPVFSTKVGDCDIVFEKLYGKQKENFIFSDENEACKKIKSFFNSKNGLKTVEKARKNLKSKFSWKKTFSKILEFLG